MSLLRNNALINNPILRTFPDNPDAWNIYVRTLNDQTVNATAVSGAIEPVAVLPTLPSASYPIGSVVYYTVNGKLYRNVANAWTVAVDGGDITANSILTNSIGAGQVTAAKISVSQLSAITADMGALTAGTITLSSGTSYIASGQSAYDTGTGFWLERNGGTPRFSIGNSAGNKITWDGTTLTVKGDLQLGRIQTFTPTYSGFSAPPTGDISYVNLGSVAIVYKTAGATGTSNASTFKITNVPAAIRPTDLTNGACSVIEDDGSGGVNYPGFWSYTSADTAYNFGTYQVLSAPGSLIRAANSITGVKGLPPGWFIIYPL